MSKIWKVGVMINDMGDKERSRKECAGVKGSTSDDVMALAFYSVERDGLLQGGGGRGSDLGGKGTVI